MNVVEIMTKKLETIDADAPLYDAIEKMIDRRIRSLLVKPKDDKDVHGVITVRDIVTKALAKNLDLTSTKVSDVSSKPLVCVDKNMDVEYAINLMSKFNITRVFVNDGRDIIGIISLLDVMSAELIKRAKEGRRA
jgi:CBS domain-containing protein